jgi:chorismate synthase
MNAMPRPGHADYTYHIKYGVHASSGGGRSSARETIGRVAAGAIAEKWLHAAYGTQIVTFVSSVGPIELPAAAMHRPDGQPWSRADVDRLGTLTILRDCAGTGWRNMRAETEAEAGASPGAAAAAAAAAIGGSAGGAAVPSTAQKAAQAVLDAADEDAFIAAYRLRCPTEAALVPTLDAAGGAGGAAAGAALATCTASASSHINPVAAAVEAVSLTTPSAGAAAAAARPAAAASAAAAAAPDAYGAGTPCYEDGEGNVYDLDGTLLPPSALALLAAACGPPHEGARSAGAAAGAASASAAAASPGDADVASYLARIRSDEVICLRCPHAPTAARMASQIRLVKAEQDSTGGVLTTVVTGVPLALGEPCFDKAEALLAHAMLSLPATKGFEIGSGFAGTRLRGSQHNDAFVRAAEAAKAADAGAGAAAAAASLLRTATNNAGGTLGGITSGADLVFRVAIKPVSTIGRAQATATYSGEAGVLEAKGRHDPCVLPRAPPLVEGMTALVLADLALIQRSRAPLHVLPPLMPAAAGGGLAAVALDALVDGAAGAADDGRAAAAAARSSMHDGKAWADEPAPHSGRKRKHGEVAK